MPILQTQEGMRGGNGDKPKKKKKMAFRTLGSISNPTASSSNGVERGIR